MSSAVLPDREKPEWERIAERLEQLVAAPTSEQAKAAATLGIALPSDVPASVAAVILRVALSEVLMEGVGSTAEIPEALTELEDELGITDHAVLTTATRAEVSAWFAARYMLKTARGLRQVQPCVGDVVELEAEPDERRVISSIGADGRLYLKGRPLRKAWPNHVTVVARVGDPAYDTTVGALQADLLNRGIYTTTSLDRFAGLKKFELVDHVPSQEAVRGLEELLESGEPREEPLQRLLTSHPGLLSALVVGGWKTYVVPKKPLGSELVPDFLVLGISSVGPQWVMVELEAARHAILNKDGSETTATRHAVKQIQDWREWLTANVAYAHDTLGLYGLTNRSPGLVVIGRADPASGRSPARAQSEEQRGIAIHSWDWLLRAAQNLARTATQVSDFAVRNATPYLDPFPAVPGRPAVADGDDSSPPRWDEESPF